MNITEFKYRCSSDKEAIVLYRLVTSLFLMTKKIQKDHTLVFYFHYDVYFLSLWNFGLFFCMVMLYVSLIVEGMIWYSEII